MTRRWRPLPDSPAPGVSYLAEVLREFEDRSALSPNAGSRHE
ncbi:hypothetical protein [Kutzneria sp. CA-103260]|nr:hypothetical protein [Kutzneria sp. CA-103260]QUQ64270.1 hypothetical protein JJ691_19900 [Kutzneria sp. CA-103260]